MTPRIGDWRVQHLPCCRSHVFLSHCAEDRERLVLPVYEALRAGGISPWVDQHNYPLGQGAYEALREGILLCRHVVYLVTAAFLNQGRGWNSIENAFANLLQENLRFGSLELCHIQFPLFFVPRNHEILTRSAWGPLVHRGWFYGSGRVDAGATEMAARQITSFIEQEEIRGVNLAAQLETDVRFQAWLQSEPNLLRRVMCADPPPVRLNTPD